MDQGFDFVGKIVEMVMIAIMMAGGGPGGPTPEPVYIPPPAVTVPALAYEGPNIVEIRLVHESIPEIHPEMGGEGIERLVLERRTLLNLEDIAGVESSNDSHTGRPILLMTLTADGAQKFHEITGQNIGRRIAILFEGRVLAAPTIRSAIPGGEVPVAGMRSNREAEHIADVINQAIASAESR